MSMPTKETSAMLVAIMTLYEALPLAGQITISREVVRRLEEVAKRETARRAAETAQ